MKFRTEIEVKPFGNIIDHRTKITMIGSCFTDEIGRHLARQLFDVDINPFGTLYNPASICDAITDAIAGRRFAGEELFLHEGRYHTYRRHSSFSRIDREAMIDELNSLLDSTAARLAETDLLIITLGSAIAFVDKSSGNIVANCHKQPAEMFDRKMLSVDYICETWQELIGKLRSVNPAIKIIFTVSPVRHSGYGLQLDRLSKSILIVAANNLADGKSVLYFPSYEMLVDDLRDYRFYAADLSHPTPMAVEYIYSQFVSATMSDSTIAIATQCEKKCRQASHIFNNEADRAKALAGIIDSLGRLTADFELNRQLTQRFKNYYLNK